MRTRWGVIWLCVGTTAMLGSQADGQQPLTRATPEDAGLAAPYLERITDLLEESVAQERVAGAVVGVARNGRVAYLQSVGVQDLASQTPMTDRSLFRVYSMTKAVTAVATMILHEEGRFQLSDPISRYLPEFADVMVLNPDGTTRQPVRPITVEHLLLHTSGLSHRTSPQYREAGVRSRSIRLTQFVENIVRVPLRFDPGERYLYSASPTVLGRLVEVWSGKPFDAFLEERVLGPLGMHDTGFWVEPREQGRLTQVYARTDGGGLRPFEIEEVPFTERPLLIEGAVGLVSTVPDFLRFAQMLLNGGELDGARILRRSTVEAMTRNGLPDRIVASRRGMGWGLGNVAVVVDAAADPGVHVAEYGWDGSAGTQFWVDPNTGLVVVTMWQNSPANPDQLRQRILDLARRAAGG